MQVRGGTEAAGDVGSYRLEARVPALHLPPSLRLSIAPPLHRCCCEREGERKGERIREKGEG